MRRALPLLVIATAGAVFSGCAATSVQRDAEKLGAPAGAAQKGPRATAGVDKRARRRCVSGTTRSLGNARVAYAATVRARARAYRQPGRGALADFGPRNVNDYPTTFGVVGAVLGRDCRARWFRVQLPMRPNGIIGYVRARDVRLSTVATRIVVDLSKRRLTFFRNGRRVLHAVAAVGSRATPTPIGRYYVNQRLIAPDPAGPYGPAALGVSAFSEVLRNWTQGGPIGIHGTNARWSIGHAVSNGCIRLDNAVIRRLFAEAPAGTPVIIRA